jgi:hypothetical protein
MACIDAPAKPPTVVLDSAGVRITITHGAESVYATLAPEPTLDFGGPEAAGATQFANIRGVRVDRRGNLLVADGATNQLRIFAPDGAHVRSVGRAGEGPGEFRRIRLLGVLGGDRVALWDDATSLLTVVDATGELVSSVRTWSGEEIQPRGFDVYADGTVLVMEGRILEADSLTPNQLIPETVTLARLHPDERTHDPVAAYAGTTWLWTGDNQIPLPFTGTSAAFALRGEEVHVVAGPEASFRIRIFRDGRLVESYGVDRPARPVTDADVQLYRESLGGLNDAKLKSQYLSALDHPSRPRRLPAYAQILAADDGSTWARVYTADPWSRGTWDVFAPDRSWRGQVHAPTRFLAHVVHQNRLIGVWYDDLDVEHVRAYTFTPTRTSP